MGDLLTEIGREFCIFQNIGIKGFGMVGLEQVEEIAGEMPLGVGAKHLGRGAVDASGKFDAVGKVLVERNIFGTDEIQTAQEDAFVGGGTEVVLADAVKFGAVVHLGDLALVSD